MDIKGYVALASKVQGWMNEAELTWLAEQAAKHRFIVEFGSWKGRSTLALAATPGIVYAVDTWSGSLEGQPFEPELFEQFRINTDHFRSVIRPLRMTTAEAKDKLASRGLVDMVFIDAGHKYDEVCLDIQIAKHLLADRGLLCGHDFSDDYPGVRHAVEQLVPGFQRVPGGDLWFKELP